MGDILERFFSMPFPLRIIFLLMLLSPALALSSVLSGSVAQPGQPLFEYGAAKSLVEVTLAVATAIPACIVGILILCKHRHARALFPIAYLGNCIGPFVLSVMREDFKNFITSLLFVSVIGILISVYLYVSREVRQYFGVCLGGAPDAGDE